MFAPRCHARLSLDRAQRTCALSSSPGDRYGSLPVKERSVFLACHTFLPSLLHISLPWTHSRFLNFVPFPRRVPHPNFQSFLLQFGVGKQPVAGLSREGQFIRFTSHLTLILLQGAPEGGLSNCNSLEIASLLSF